MRHAKPVPPAWPRPPADLLQTARSIAAAQLPSGAIAWPDGHVDPWDHVECAMALAACGQQASLGSSGASAPAVATGANFPADSTMAKLASAGTLRVGTKFDQPLFGLDRDDLRDRIGIELEIGSSARTHLEHPARQPRQVLPAELPHLLRLVCGDSGPDACEERMVDGVRGR